MTQSGTDLRVTVTLILTLGVLLASVMPASRGKVSGPGPTSSLGEVLWPPENHTRDTDIQSLAYHLFRNKTGTPLTLGLRTISSFEVESTNETSSQVTIREEGGQNHTFTQHHRPVTGMANDTVKVDPDQLRRTVEVRPSEGTLVLHVVGPPGSFNLRGDTLDRKLRDFIHRIELPNATTIGSEIGVGLIKLYHGETACVEQSEARCKSETFFQLACDGCKRIGMGLHGLNRETRTALGDDPAISASAGGASVIFNPDGDMVAARVTMFFDVNEGVLLDPSEARDRITDHVRQQGYRVGGPQTASDPNASYINTASLDFSLSERHVRPTQAYYRWSSFHVTTTSESNNGSADHQVARYVQDAQTGNIVHFEFRPAALASEPGGPTNPLPSSSAFLMLVAGTVGGALIWYHRLSG